jgi:hypothetical protein
MLMIEDLDMGFEAMLGGVCWCGVGIIIVGFGSFFGVVSEDVVNMGGLCAVGFVISGIKLLVAIEAEFAVAVFLIGVSVSVNIHSS